MGTSHSRHLEIHSRGYLGEKQSSDYLKWLESFNGEETISPSREHDKTLGRCKRDSDSSDSTETLSSTEKTVSTDNIRGRKQRKRKRNRGSKIGFFRGNSDTEDSSVVETAGGIEEHCTHETTCQFSAVNETTQQLNKPNHMASNKQEELDDQQELVPMKAVEDFENKLCFLFREEIDDKIKSGFKKALMDFERLIEVQDRVRNIILSLINEQVNQNEKQQSKHAKHEEDRSDSDTDSEPEAENSGQEVPHQQRQQAAYDGQTIQAPHVLAGESMLDHAANTKPGTYVSRNSTVAVPRFTENELTTMLDQDTLHTDEIYKDSEKTFFSDLELRVQTDDEMLSDLKFPEPTLHIDEETHAKNIIKDKPKLELTANQSFSSSYPMTTQTDKGFDSLNSQLSSSDSLGVRRKYLNSYESNQSDKNTNRSEDYKQAELNEHSDGLDRSQPVLDESIGDTVVLSSISVEYSPIVSRVSSGSIVDSHGDTPIVGNQHESNSSANEQSADSATQQRQPSTAEARGPGFRQPLTTEARGPPLPGAGQTAQRAPAPGPTRPPQPRGTGPGTNQAQPPPNQAPEIHVANPKHPEYITMQSRIESFTTWPSRIQQSHRQMAESGLFYVGRDGQCYIICMSVLCNMRLQIKM